MSQVAALGFRAHSGWTTVVAVAGLPDRPMILERGRIETADVAIPGSKQPYHAAERLSHGEAEPLIRQCRNSSMRLTTRAIGALIDRLEQSSFAVVGAGILFASGRPLPDLAAILRSHALIHTAEGEFFREVLVHASEECSLPVTKIKEREAWDIGATVLRTPAGDLQKQIAEVGKAIGPPWREDEKLASLAAWIALIEAKSGATPA